MRFARKHWILIAGVVLLVYVLWLGAHDETAPSGSTASPGFGTSSNDADLDSLMTSATSGAANSVTIAGEKVSLT